MLENLQTPWLYDHGHVLFWWFDFLWGMEKRWWFCWAAQRSWRTEGKLGGRSSTTAMPSCWRFDEDTWEQHTRTMSWGVTLTWDEALFIPGALLVFLFPVSLVSASHDSLGSLWSSAYLLPTSSSLISNSPSVGMLLSTFSKRINSRSGIKSKKTCYRMHVPVSNKILRIRLKVIKFWILPKPLKNLNIIEFLWEFLKLYIFFFIWNG